MTSVRKKEGVITELTVVNLNNPAEKPLKIKAKMFIDATYEGDLLAQAGVSFALGREDNKTYGETINGVQLKQHHQFPNNIDPYIVQGDPKSGLCYGIQADTLSPNGTGDKKMQAYNFRICLTQDKSNFIPITAPKNYDPSKYELLRRVIAQRTSEGWVHLLKSYLLINYMPNSKSDMNNMGPFSTDFIGENWDYVNANFATRKKIADAHADYDKGLFYFLGHDAAVPENLRNEMLSWGYPKDEFQDNAGFPHQLYVREGRRMIGEYVMTEHNCLGKESVKDGIGLAAYTMDSHNCQRIVVKGMVKNEGDVQIGGFPPFPISYRSITPKRSECTNLLVPVSMSASHIAFGSIRMEPVFMVLAQSAAVAACMAIDAKLPVQEIQVPALQKILLENPYLDGTQAEVLVDNSDETGIGLTGKWAKTKMKDVSYKMDYLLINQDSATTSSVKFSPKIPQTRNYTVYFYCPEKPKDAPVWAKTASVKIFDGASYKTILVNQDEHRHHWVNIGVYKLDSAKKSSIEVIADKPGVVIADAFILVPTTRFEESK